MKYQVHDNLSFGDISCCRHINDGSIAIVHACKEPCHRNAVGYSGRSLSSSHPCYLIFESDFNLYLNLIDPPAPLFMMPSFLAFMAFVDKHIKHREVIIHCNLGESRAPSLALLYLAKRTTVLPNDSYENAAQAFAANFPYSPGQGIRLWLSKNWNNIK